MPAEEHSLPTAMTGYTDVVQRDMPPPLPPRLYCNGRSGCHCQPSSSGEYPPKQCLQSYANSFNLFSTGLEPPPSDFDANSVGFVDIEELRALEEYDRVSVVSVPVLPLVTKRKSFASLRKWMPRRRSVAAYGYDNLATTAKQSDEYRDIYRVRKASSVSSVVLPYPSKKPSFRKTLKKFVFCGSR
ncbi:unnamed protein product [Nippostrongylus brasiliensis]|uniref:Uncharacterized protein n=1 Tax=Nippostrongylus brasiliensis TaxID=27835 RepID=A0A0N4YMP4_NIPBR|nr:unnamed protein product [Nippostrongylus brasiliensis]